MSVRAGGVATNWKPVEQDRPAAPKYGFLFSVQLAQEQHDMPGIDYRLVRELVTVRAVLELLEFQPTEVQGDQWRGPCPIHGSKSPTSRSFSVHAGTGAFRCFSCGAAGNQLDLWAAAKSLSLFDAALDLCHQLNLEVPEIKHW